jgi:uncharacterized membrane protein YeaQ/YmgE (transglycosylase-associated protein family)
MIVTFILGALAGWFAKLAEPRVKEGLTRVDAGSAPGAVEVPLLALAGSILVAAVVAGLLMDEPSPVALALGACVGVLGPRIRRRWDARKIPDYDS